MFEEIKDGKKIDVHGLKCWIPPVGYGYHVDPEWAKQAEAKTGLHISLLERVEVLKRSNKKEEQFWERPVMPAELQDWKDEEERRQFTDKDYQHPELAKIKRREWHRRLYGVWFYNNGTPVYLTGTHYFYLTHWKIDIGYPDYRKIDLEYFYYWQYASEDPKSFGIIEITRRRAGKSYRASCILFEYLSRWANSQGGIQSKTKEDAADFFQNKLVPSFSALPYFFVPTYDTTKGDTPKEELRFFRTTKKGKAAKEARKEPDLQSTITFRDSKAKAYDGRKLKVYVGDESGKVQIDILDRHKVLKYCLLDNRRRIVGKMIITSTVEELGVRYGFDKLWYQSDPKERMENGQTKSGLYKFFIPAHHGGDYDIYGNPYVEETLNAINIDRAAHADNMEELNAIIRKEPMTEEEAFFVDAKQCHFNPNTLNFRLSDLSILKNYKERGNFSWQNGERDTRVIWTPDPKGRWEICWLFEEAGRSNNVTRRAGNRFSPNNALSFVTGCDPFDHDQVEDVARRSMGAAFTLRRHNPDMENHPYNKAFVCKYLYRHEIAYLFYEDMIMQCFYFGSPLLFENNKPGIGKYFEGRGYKDFLIHYSDRKDAGVPSSTENKILMLETMQEYFKEHINKQFFPDLLHDLLKFEIANTQKYDLSMAAGWTLFADANSIARKGSSTGLKDVQKLFKRYAA